MADIIKVFISSTSDLGEEREAIAKKFPQSIRAYLYERDRPRRVNGRDWCKKQIEGSKIFVGILGGEWGTPYPPPDHDGSIVEWEFDTARARPELEIMIFIRKLQPTAVQPNQQEFINRVEDFETGVWRTSFDTIPDLVTDVIGSVFDWYIDYAEEEKKKQAQIPSKLHKFLAPISFGALGIVALTFVLSVIYHISPIFIWISGGFGALVLGGCYLLIRSQMGGLNGRST